MNEQSAGVVVNELRRLESEIGKLAGRIEGRRSLPPSEKEDVAAAYSALKDELRRLRKAGTVGGAHRDRADSEERFFLPAVSKALIALRAPTNSNPISSNWAGQLYEAQSEVSYQLHRLESELK